jgi:hypothetical protein
VTTKSAAAHSEYVRHTENAEACYKREVQDVYLSIANSWPPIASERHRQRLEKAAAEYSRRILGAYDLHRPNGPEPGEVLPHEVVRLRDIAEAKKNQ